MRYFFLSISCILIIACNSEPDNRKNTAKFSGQKPLSFSVKTVLLHDPESFTQGLDFDGNKLVESTGGNGSWIGLVNLANGKPDKKVVLDNRYFGEGITILNDKIYQLTWKSKTGFVYDLSTFKQVRTFTYDREGWGITTDNKQLIMSDGTDKLYFLDTISLNPVKVLSIQENGNPIDKLNELEYIEGYVFANRWQTDYIYKIDPETGNVLGRLDFTFLTDELRREDPGIDVLNGIAYNEITKEIYITGKWWPKAYIISLN